MAFKHETREARQIIEHSEQWSAEIDGYDVYVSRREDGFTEVSVAPISYDNLRLPLLRFYPKRVADIERVIAALPHLLLAMVEEMRAAGLDDLRSRSDVMMDESRDRREEILASFRSSDGT